jgi:uncharacterized protein (TIGR02757 family)
VKLSTERRELKALLDQKVLQYNRPEFIANDPLSIPHLFTRKEDIEISGFLAATLAWGNRKSIIKNATSLLNAMDNAPHQFVTGYSLKDLARVKSFVHRTFNGADCRFFIKALGNIYLHHTGLEHAFALKHNDTDRSLRQRIINFRHVFLEVRHPMRSEKHISNPARKSSAKRICMFLRWMVRKDHKKVDFGIWNNIDPAELCLPLDVHTGHISRQLGLLQRKQNDWQAVEEVTAVLRDFDAQDPVKYDFALFGMGVNKDLR